MLFIWVVGGDEDVEWEGRLILIGETRGLWVDILVLLLLLIFISLK